jgi:hypothetical protein
MTTSIYASDIGCLSFLNARRRVAESRDSRESRSVSNSETDSETTQARDGAGPGYRGNQQIHTERMGFHGILDCNV